MGNNKQRSRQVVVWAFALALVVSLSGCGYHFKGLGLEPPEGVTAIAVSILENRTVDVGLETVFTGDLTYEFTRSKVVQVVAKEKADAVLKGAIASITVDTISHTENYISDERRVTVRLDLSLVRSDGTVLWADPRLSDSEVFRVASDRITTDRNKRAAIETVSGRLAEKAHNRIFQGF